MDEIIKSIPSATRYFFGLMFVVFFLALVCSLGAEVLSRILGLRSKTLQQAVQRLLGSGVAKTFYTHPFIGGLARTTPTDLGKPGYIPSQVFALVLLDLISSHSAQRDAAAIHEGIDRILDPGVRHLMQLFVRNSEGDLRRLQASIRFWFNYSMDRVSVLYRRKIQAVLFLLGFILSFGLNADAIMITNTLAVSEPVTSAISQIAQVRIKSLKPPGDLEESRRVVEAVVSQLDELSLLGWSVNPASRRAIPSSAQTWIWKVIGLLLTASGITFLAPILFDLLNKVVVVRDAERKYDVEIDA